MIRFACLGAFLVALALGPASATGGCGVGCHSTSAGACVRDGRMAGGFARSERMSGHIPASSPLRPLSPMESAIHDVYSHLNRPGVTGTKKPPLD